MSYQAQSYSNQGTAYGGNQETSWGDNGYSANRETTNRAAEVLQNMNNAAYTTSNATAVSQHELTARSATTAQRYSSNTTQGHTHQTSKIYSASSAYGRSQARPHSVNANRTQTTASPSLPLPAMPVSRPPQRASTAFDQQQQRAASPAQGTAQYNHTSQLPARNTTMTGNPQYNDYSSRQLPNLNATRGTTAAASTSYNYDDARASTATLQAPANNPAETYHQGAVTVDPMAVYDPWPEYQRKQEALLAQKAVEDAARAEEELTRRAREKEEKRKEAERKKQEDEERTWQASLNKPNKSRTAQQTAGAEGSSATSAGDVGESSLGGDMESEIRALMAKMREYNSKDPAMLARIWEEERRAKAPKSPIVPPKVVPQAAPATRPAQTSAAPSANQRKKVSANRELSAAAVAKPANKIAAPTITQYASRPTVPGAVASPRPGGNTIWPPEKKATLASAAATYLTGQNPQMPVLSEQVLSMLDGNPSYIELCEQLENLGIKLDRAAFAKNLLTAVPDVNSASRAKPAPLSNHGVVAPSVPVAPPAVMKRDISTLAATPTSTSNHSSATPSTVYPSFPGSSMPSAPIYAPVAEMVPIKPELKRPATKEEAARKRDFSDLIDLTQADEDDLEPPAKRNHMAFMSSVAPTSYSPSGYMDLDEGSATTKIAGSAYNTPQSVTQHPIPPAPHAHDLRHADIVEPIDRKKALRRNTYNIKTIARDVLLACGRHPEQRQLNQHLDVLRVALPQVQQDADLSTLRWDIIDPGDPPRGYFKDSIQNLAEDADDEDNEDEDEYTRRLQGLPLQPKDGMCHQKVQAPPLSEAINPFKPRRGRPPRSSFGPDRTTTPSKPPHSIATMSASAPRAASAGVGYSAFRSATQYDANGNPVPKKRGRPVGWRKHIHGSAQAQAQPSANQHATPRQFQFKPSEPRAHDMNPTNTTPIRIDSRSPSVPNTSRYQSFKCKWLGCKAELHNLDTLKKHVYKVHRSSVNNSGFIECHWADCATEIANEDAMSGTRMEQHKPKSFTTITNWMKHLEQVHFGPLSWELGDGPASGVSGLQNHSSSCTHTDVNRLIRYD